jgi:spore coat protein U-like protein
MTLRSRWLLGAALLMTWQPLWSASCTVSAHGIDFGNYDPFSNQNLDSTANISVVCDVSTTYSVALSPGGGSFGSRVMSNGLHQLLYNLYTDATLATVWGDATGGTAIVGATGLTANHTVYGRIPARQNAYVGFYNDTIVVTLTF